MRPLIGYALLALIGQIPLTAASHFVTTAAGTVPPIANSVAAKQYLPQINGGMAYDSQGNLYYASSKQVWRLNTDGTDTLIAGNATPGAISGAGGLATAAVFSLIFGIAVDAQGNLYIAEFGSGGTPTQLAGSIQKVTPDGQITTLVSDIIALSVAVDSAGNVYVLAYTPGNINGASLTEYSPNGTVRVIATTIAGNVAQLVLVGEVAITNGSADGLLQIDLKSGVVTTLLANSPSGGLAAGPDGYIYFSDGNKVSKFKPATSNIILVAGTGQASSTGDGGPATQATFGDGTVAVSPLNDNVAVWDSIGFRVRVIASATGKIQTVAGAPHSAGDNGPAILAQFELAVRGAGEAVSGLAGDPAGNIYFWDTAGTSIRKVSPSGIVTTVAGTGLAGNTGDGGKAVLAEVAPGGTMAADTKGNLFFVNASGVFTGTILLGGVPLQVQGTLATIREIDANGIISTVAGGGSQPVSNGAQALSITLPVLTGSPILAVDASGNLYLAYAGVDEIGRIIRIDTSRTISIIAGGGTVFSDVDGTPALSAALGIPGSLAVDNSGKIYFGEGSRIRTIDMRGSLVTVAGVAAAGVNGSAIQPGPAISAQIGTPEQLIIDSSGNLIFYADTGSTSPQIAAVDPSGNLTVLAGAKSAVSGLAVSAGDGGDAANANFTSIGGLAVDPSGDVYVADGDAYIRKLAPYDPAKPPPFVAAGGVVGSGGSVPALAAVAPDGDASVYGANFIAAGTHRDLSSSDLVNGKVPTVLAGVCVNFGGVPAAMLNVYPSQINIQVPANLPAGPVLVQVILNCGTGAATQSNFGGVAMQTASPEFFSFLPDPVAGNNPIAAINAVTFVRVGMPGLLPGVTFAAVKPGDILEAYGTGWGLTAPPLSVGVIPGAAASLASPYTLTFAGSTVPAASIFYAGAAPCCAGLYQVDFTVPAGTPSGNQPLVITVGGAASPPHAFVTVQ